MAVKKIYGEMNVLEAAKCRIQNIFDNGMKVYMTFSAGKDSLCMSHMVYDKIMKGEINAKQLIVIFIDEEALYPSMEQMALRWRERFISVGAEFRWYCLPLKQISVLHQLQNDEAWITWEPGKEWIRPIPKFAITRDPRLEYTGQMTYQTFCERITKDGIQMVGVRAWESVQRLDYLSTAKMSAGNIASGNKIYPIYDWKDSDIWLYIKENHLDFPDSYIDLYRAGVSKGRLRLCNFFASEGIQGLRWVAETDHTLWERIERREPNAYLTLLYWDSEMFHRRTNKRSQMEGESKKDYRALCKDMLFTNPDKYFTNEQTRYIAEQYRKFYIKCYELMTDKHFQRMYEALISGDPKKRTLRSLYITVGTDYAKVSKSSRMVKT